MSITIEIPRRIYEEITRRGLDAESFIIDTVLSRLKLDPKDEAELHVEIAEQFMGEAREYLNKNNAVQASEKLYKAAEECIKALAIAVKAPEAEKAAVEGRWFTWLLDKAARSVAKALNEYRVKNAWDTAYGLHVWGFHEARLSVDDVRLDVPQIEWLIDYTRRIMKEKTQ